MADSRRDFIKKGALIGLAGLAGSVIGKNGAALIDPLAGFPGAGNGFKLPNLPYEFDALEPFIDARTMEIHYTKHHQAYVDKLNTVPASEFDMNASDDEKCGKINQASSSLLRNNLGGHYNHSLFWKFLTPAPMAKGPTGKLESAITQQFKSVDDFKKEFSEKAAKIFGSGWCWLIKNEEGKLAVTTTPNQDNPLMQTASDRGKPLLALDVWEHAYYLKYQNKRADYITAWWNVVNWETVQQQFAG